MAWIAKLADYDRDADRRHARSMLARLTPFGEWSKEEETVARARMWLRVARNVLDIADLAPDEHQRECARIELAAAVAFTEGSKVEPA